MQIYKNLSAEQKFVVKAVVVLLVLFAAAHMVVQYASQYGSPVARGGYTSDMVSVAPYGDTKTESAFIDPIMPPIGEVSVPGTDAEEYEVQQYFLSVETSDRERDCAVLLELKQRDDVIFESVNESTYGCNVTFKVARDSVESVLAYLEELDPRDVNENTYTIKREVSRYEDQISILEAKRRALDTALDDALTNFAEVEALARRTGDVASLAQITESKISSIERINASRLAVAMELDRLSRAKAEVLDQMNYAHFSVNVFEKELVRGDDLKDSWFAAVQRLVFDLNSFLQDLSIGFVQFVLSVVKYALYASVLYLIARPVIVRAAQAWKRM